jgi:protein ImuA
VRPYPIAALRASLRALEESSGKSPAYLSFGNAGARLGESLRYGALHEAGGPAATLFIVLVLARTRGRILCCAPGWSDNRLYPPGLVQLGLDPARIVLVRLARAEELLHAAHEGLRAGWHVVLELDKPLGLIPVRRLQLAAEEGGGLGLVTRANAEPSCEDAFVPSARTRWRVAIAGSSASGVAASGLWPAPLRLDLRLLRNREGLPGQFCVEWDHASRSLSVVSASSDRQDRAPRSEVA